MHPSVVWKQNNNNSKATIQKQQILPAFTDRENRAKHTVFNVIPPSKTSSMVVTVTAATIAFTYCLSFCSNLSLSLFRPSHPHVWRIGFGLTKTDRISDVPANKQSKQWITLAFSFILEYNLMVVGLKSVDAVCGGIVYTGLFKSAGNGEWWYW